MNCWRCCTSQQCSVETSIILITIARVHVVFESFFLVFCIAIIADVFFQLLFMTSAACLLASSSLQRHAYLLAVFVVDVDDA